MKRTPIISKESQMLAFDNRNLGLGQCPVRYPASPHLIRTINPKRLYQDVFIWKGNKLPNRNNIVNVAIKLLYCTKMKRNGKKLICMNQKAAKMSSNKISSKV